MTDEMTESIRTFIAVEVVLPSPLRAIVRRLHEMGRAVKAVDPDVTHITLKFLGETTRDRISAVQTVLERTAKDAVPFELELNGIGAFPHWGRPSVVWAGVAEPEPLCQFARRLEAGLEPLDFPRDNHEYHPHLTLARIKAKPPGELRSLRKEYEGTSFGRQTIGQVVYYQSELQPAGPIYTPLCTVPFTAG